MIEIAKTQLRTFTYWTGFAGTAVILLSAIATALAFTGGGRFSYSIMNRHISALGEPYLSEWAALFNWGLVVGGAFLVLFMMGLGLYVNHPFMLLPMSSGIITAFGVILVGIFPASYMLYHKAAALVFFLSGWTTFVLFTAALLWTDQPRLAKWLVLPSALNVLIFTFFVAVPFALYDDPVGTFFVGPPGPDYPTVWLPALLEWSVLLSVTTWILCVSGVLWRQQQMSEEQCDEQHPPGEHREHREYREQLVDFLPVARDSDQSAGD
jgi:hypothetical membrane protein